jgi:hypothetical protein
MRNMSPEMACFAETEEAERSRDFAALVVLACVTCGAILVCGLVAWWAVRS